MSNRRLAIAELLNPVNSIQYMPFSATNLTPSDFNPPPAPILPNPLTPPHALHNPEIRHNVYVNRKTMLSRLYIYHDTSAYVEYLSTDATNPIGYMFRQDPLDWQNPVRNIVYSRGRPAGYTRPGNHIYCNPLVDENNVVVPCVKRHSTCM